MLASQTHRAIAILESAHPRDVAATKCRRGVSAARWSHDGKFFAVGGKEGFVQMWSADKLLAVPPPRFADVEWAAHSREITALTFKPDSHAFLATCTDDGTIKVWNTIDRTKQHSGTPAGGADRSKELYKLGAPSHLPVQLVWNPYDESILLTVSQARAPLSDKILRVFDLNRGEATHTVKDVTAVAFHPYLKCAVIGRPSGSISFLTPEWEECHTIRDHVASCTTLTPDPMKHFIFSSGADGCVNVHDAEYLEPVRGCKNDGDNIFSQLSVSGDGELLAGACDTNQAYIWHTGTGLVANVLQAPRKIGWVQWHPQRAVLAFGYSRDDSGTFRVIAA
ncbi:hypothetical protein RI367_000375 [Sorochytrium milnesiophthora]